MRAWSDLQEIFIRFFSISFDCGCQFFAERFNKIEQFRVDMLKLKITVAGKTTLAAGIVQGIISLMTIN